MKLSVVLITDDLYLKVGFEEFSKRYNERLAHVLHVTVGKSNKKAFTTLSKYNTDTFFIIALQSDALRLAVCKSIPIQESHVVFMFDSLDPGLTPSNHQSVFLSKKMSLLSFWDLLTRYTDDQFVERSSYWGKSLSIDSTTFEMLADGTSIVDSATALAVRSKRLYSIRKRMLSQYDFGKSASVAFKMHMMNKVLMARGLLDN